MFSKNQVLRKDTSMKNMLKRLLLLSIMLVPQAELPAAGKQKATKGDPIEAQLEVLDKSVAAAGAGDATALVAALNGYTAPVSSVMGSIKRKNLWLKIDAAVAAKAAGIAGDALDNVKAAYSKVLNRLMTSGQIKANLDSKKSVYLADAGFAKSIGAGIAVPPVLTKVKTPPVEPPVITDAAKADTITAAKAEAQVHYDAMAAKITEGDGFITGAVAGIKDTDLAQAKTLLADSKAKKNGLDAKIAAGPKYEGIIAYLQEFTDAHVYVDQKVAAMPPLLVAAGPDHDEIQKNAFIAAATAAVADMVTVIATAQGIIDAADKATKDVKDAQDLVDAAVAKKNLENVKLTPAAPFTKATAQALAAALAASLTTMQADLAEVKIKTGIKDKAPIVPPVTPIVPPVTPIVVPPAGAALQTAFDNALVAALNGAAATAKTKDWVNGVLVSVVTEFNKCVGKTLVDKQVEDFKILLQNVKDKLVEANPMDKELIKRLDVLIGKLTGNPDDKVELQKAFKVIA